MTNVEAQLFVPASGDSPIEVISRFFLTPDHITYGQPGRLGWSTAIPQFDRPIHLALRRIDGDFTGVTVAIFAFRLRRGIDSDVDMQGARDTVNVTLNPEADLNAGAPSSPSGWVSYPVGIQEDVEIVDVTVHFASALPIPE